MIYLDHAATTPVRKEVLDTMLPYLTSACGNPSSAYEYAFAPRDAIKKAREQVASVIKVSPEQIFFTSGGSESDNWALVGMARSLASKGRHLITSAIEHHAILHTMDFLESIGFSVTRLPVSSDGLVSPEDLEQAIRPDTILVSIMMANNEIGTIQPIKELASVAHAHDVLFHTDAVQAFGQIPIDVPALGIDLLSASSHKLYGPKGVGCLYIREGITISPLIFGGGQEHGMRAGTENIAGIAGFGKACELAMAELTETMQRETKLRDWFFEVIPSVIPDCIINGSQKDRLPGNIHISIPGVEGTSLLLLLDLQGVCASAGSACSAASLAPSHVLQAIGLVPDYIKGSLRLTIGRTTTREELEEMLAILDEVVSSLRS